MAKSRKGSPVHSSIKLKMTRRKSNVTLADHSYSSSTSADSSSKLNLHLSSSLSDEEKSLDVTNVVSNCNIKSEIDEKLLCLVNNSKSPAEISTGILNKPEESFSNTNNSAAFSSSVSNKVDSSVWSVRPSDVFKPSDSNVKRKNSLSNKSRRKTMAFGDKSNQGYCSSPVISSPSVELPPTQPTGPLKG